MEFIATDVQHALTVKTGDASIVDIVGCPYHNVSFAVSEQGRMYTLSLDSQCIDLTTDQELDTIVQVVCNCRETQEQCTFYIRTSLNDLYQWNIDLSHDHPRKRVKLQDSHQSQVHTKLKLVANDIQLMVEQDGLILISADNVRKLEHGKLRETQLFYPCDTNISYHTIVDRIHSSFVSFFSLPSNSGLLYGTHEGDVCWRSVDAQQDVSLFKLDEEEDVLFLDAMEGLSDGVSELVVAIGKQGTIIMYTATESSALELRQFNIPSPVYAIDKVEDLVYIISTGLGKVSLLDLRTAMKDDNIIFTRMRNMSDVKHLRIFDCKKHIFEIVASDSSSAEFKRIQYNPSPVPLGEDPEEIESLIKDTLQELAQSESTLKSMRAEEENLSQSLMSTNRTLYALRSINEKRKLGICNTLDSTGFECTVRPVTKSNSNENCSLSTRAFLRICIKTSQFLELENWSMNVDLFTLGSTEGQRKTLSVIGFEPYYDNGIERYIIWERDLEIDPSLLPLHAHVSLVMSLSDAKDIVFPVSDLRVDDLHFAIPCSSNVKTSIERRGLEEITDRFRQSYKQQVLHDRTGTYPFERLVSHVEEQKALISAKNVHIQYTVDDSLDNDKYRALLSNVLGEGRSREDMLLILGDGAEQALFTLVSFPGCPVIIRLSRVSPTLIDLCIQCAYTPTLFRVEALLLQRIDYLFVKDAMLVDQEKKGKQSIDLIKRIKSLQESVIQLQEVYQSKDDKATQHQLKQTIDLLYSIQNQKPMGFLSLQ